MTSTSAVAVRAGDELSVTVHRYKAETNPHSGIEFFEKLVVAAEALLNVSVSPETFAHE